MRHLSQFLLVNVYFYVVGLQRSVGIAYFVGATFGATRVHLT